MGFDEIGPEGEGEAVAGFGLVKTAELLESVPQVAVGLDEIGPEGEGEAVAGFRLIKTAKFLEGVPQVAVGLGVLRREIC